MLTQNTIINVKPGKEEMLVVISMIRLFKNNLKCIYTILINNISPL